MHAQALFESSPRALARIGGVLYLVIIVLGIFGEAFVRGSLCLWLIVKGVDVEKWQLRVSVNPI